MAELPENPYLIDLFDQDGNKTVFEHLDTVLYKDNEYVICIPYDEKEEEVSEIVILKASEDGDGEPALEQITEPSVMSAVYDIFRDRNADKFDFEV